MQYLLEVRQGGSIRGTVEYLGCQSLELCPGLRGGSWTYCGAACGLRWVKPRARAMRGRAAEMSRRWSRDGLASTRVARYALHHWATAPSVFSPSLRKRVY